MLAQLVIQFALAGLEVAVDRLLELLGQLLRDLSLGPPKQERPQRTGQHLAAVGALFVADQALEPGRAAEDAGIKKPKRAPPPGHPIPPRGAGQPQPVPRPQ